MKMETVATKKKRKAHPFQFPLKTEERRTILISHFIRCVPHINDLCETTQTKIN